MVDSEYRPMTAAEREELDARIDDCRRRILAHFGIEWNPGVGNADERGKAHVPPAGTVG